VTSHCVLIKGIFLGLYQYEQDVLPPLATTLSSGLTLKKMNEKNKRTDKGYMLDRRYGFPSTLLPSEVKNISYMCVSLLRLPHSFGRIRRRYYEGGGLGNQKPGLRYEDDAIGVLTKA